MVSLLATTSFALHTPLALWFDRRMLRHPGLAAPRADDGFDQILEHSSQADAPSLPCLCVTPEGKLEEEGRVVGAALCVGNAQEQSAALALVGSVEWILVEAGAPQPCIVAENLLAATEGSPTRVAVCVDSAASVPGLAFALQRGVDALVCPADVATGELLEALQVAKAQRLEVADAPAPAAASTTSGGGLDSERIRPEILPFDSLPGFWLEAPCVYFKVGVLISFPSIPSQASGLKLRSWIECFTATSLMLICTRVSRAARSSRVQETRRFTNW